MSQRDTEETLKAITREQQDGPVTAGRRVSAALWVMIMSAALCVMLTVRNGTGSRLRTSLETTELKTRQNSGPLEIQPHLGSDFQRRSSERSWALGSQVLGAEP